MKQMVVTPTRLHPTTREPVCPTHQDPMSATVVRDFESGITALHWRCWGGCITAAVPLPDRWAMQLAVGLSAQSAIG